MQRNKKSFILYTDWKEMFNALSDEQAGMLIKAVFAHAMGEEVKLDAILSLLFINIRQTLDRDIDKWETIVERNRVNGLKGGRPRTKPRVTQDNPNNPVGILGTQSNPKNPDNDLFVVCPSDISEEVWSKALSVYSKDSLKGKVISNPPAYVEGIARNLQKKATIKVKTADIPYIKDLPVSL